MPTHQQGTTEKHPATQGDTLNGPAGSDAARLQGAFPTAAIGSGTPFELPAAADVSTDFGPLLQGASVNDGGHTFNTFNRDYTDAPALADVSTGGGAGEPATPQAPSIASPGVGSANPADLPAGPAPLDGAGGAFPRGDGGLDPAVTAAATAAQTLGALIFGKSAVGSDVGTP